tara:strand:+ start:22528 stop:22914 length:387 start_codon:yes stop_codon:yes gene_type:complete
MSLKQNRTWQFLVGCFCIFLAYKCWSLGLFAWFFREDTEGFESVSLMPLFLTAVVSAIQMVGLCAIMLVSGLQPLAEKTVDYIRSKMPKVDRAAKVIEEKVDAEKLIATLNSLDERIRSIEVKVGDDK